MMYQSAAAEGTQRTFVIQPNRSMSWQNLLRVYAGIAAVVIAVGVFCFYIGLPLVLPFSGLELAVLGAAFYLTAWRGGAREVITVGKDRVVVESGRSGPERREAFQRQWARVILQRSRNGWYPSRLVVRSHGREVEVGRFLNEQERLALAAELISAMKEEHAGGRSITSAVNSRGLKHVA